MEKTNKNVKKYTNQRVGTIYKCETGDKELFSIRNLTAEAYAFKNFKSVNEMRLYMYLSSNQAGYYFGYSPQDVVNTYGGTIKNMSIAFNKLTEAGYIVFDNPKDKDAFSFHEVPVSTIVYEAVKAEDKKFYDRINYIPHVETTSCQNDLMSVRHDPLMSVRHDPSCQFDWRNNTT